MSSQLSKEEIKKELFKAIDNFTGNRERHTPMLVKTIMEIFKQYANQKQSGMKWVRAEERLPKDKALAKNDGTLGLLSVFENWIEFSGRGFYHTYTFKSPQLNKIEWLDEQTLSDTNADNQDDLWGEAMEILLTQGAVELKSKFTITRKP